MNKNFKQEVINNLENETNELNYKIKKSREDENWGTYKNIIQAYTGILDLIDKYNSDNKVESDKNIITNETMKMITSQIPKERNIPTLEEIVLQSKIVWYNQIQENTANVEQKLANMISQYINKDFEKNKINNHVTIEKNLYEVIGEICNTTILYILKDEFVKKNIDYRFLQFGDNLSFITKYKKITTMVNPKSKMTMTRSLEQEDFVLGQNKLIKININKMVNEYVEYKQVTSMKVFLNNIVSNTLEVIYETFLALDSSCPNLPKIIVNDYDNPMKVVIESVFLTKENNELEFNMQLGLCLLTNEE